MNSDEKMLMEQFGITAESKTIYHLDGHRYERFSDAINHAKTRATPVLKPKIQHENPTARSDGTGLDYADRWKCERESELNRGSYD